MGQRPYNVEGIDVFEEDWDNLLILDAFRYDTFKGLIEEYDVEGTLESRVSRGSSTPEFLQGNVDGADLSDTVYVTATTMLYREGALEDRIDIRLHDVVDVWQQNVNHDSIAADPSTISDIAMDTLKEYPDKRLVVHYIQPHIPFIGETGREHFEGIDDDLWGMAVRGELDVSDRLLWEAYEENARIVLKEVESILPDLPGRTVLTSDHGQMIGDRSRPLPHREYGHPTGLYTRELVEVPWFVHESGSRREISAGGEVSDYNRTRSEEIDEQAREHLQELGYLS